MSVVSVADVFAKAPMQSPLPALEQAGAWLNTEPLGTADLRGKVVLIDFWTYTCINWRRTLPWLRAVNEKYKRDGLIVIGVHTPEFSFEKNVDNVRLATRQQQVDYPVAIDSDYVIWNAFHNQYWPALYLIDAQGRIRQQKFGEGDYEQMESAIDELLAETGHVSPHTLHATIQGTGAESAADWKSLRSPETYLGYGRADRFASPGGESPDRPRVYAAPAALALNQWALTGRWTIRSESVVSHQVNGRIMFRFHARDVHLVMQPGPGGKPIRFRVSIDGHAPASSRGVDVDADGHGTLVEPRMYQLIRQPAPIADRQFEIEFLDPGAQVFAFTFG